MQTASRCRSGTQVERKDTARVGKQETNHGSRSGIDVPYIPISVEQKYDFSKAGSLRKLLTDIRKFIDPAVELLRTAAEKDGATPTEKEIYKNVQRGMLGSRIVTIKLYDGEKYTPIVVSGSASTGINLYSDDLRRGWEGIQIILDKTNLPILEAYRKEGMSPQQNYGSVRKQLEGILYQHISTT